MTPAEWDERVRADPAVADPWCSASTWSLSVHQAFTAADTWSHADDRVALWFGRYALDGGGTALVPLDLVWQFGTPVVGICTPTDAHAAAGALAASGVQAAFLGGLRENSDAWNLLGAACTLHAQRVIVGDERVRCQASLFGGLEGWISRRTREFRRNLRQLERRVQGASITVDVLDDAPVEAVLARLHAIEQRSWKGEEGSGIESPDMARLYAGVASRLAASGRMRSAVAVDADGNDVAYVLGGVQGHTYRGLQLSFVEAARPLGLGNYLQWHELQRLCTYEPDVDTYDLGMDMAYKRRWSESPVATRTLIAVFG